MNTPSITVREALARVDRETLERIAGFAVNVLDFYADPDNYFAVLILGDHPCGDFAYDHSLIYERDERPRHGRRARLASEMIRQTLRNAVLPKSP